MLNTNSPNNPLSLLLRPVFAVALLGVMAGCTHGALAPIRPVTANDMLAEHRHDLQTHSDIGDYTGELNLYADPRHVRGKSSDHS